MRRHVEDDTALGFRRPRPYGLEAVRDGSGFPDRDGGSDDLRKGAP